MQLNGACLVELVPGRYIQDEEIDDVTGGHLGAAGAIACRSGVPPFSWMGQQPYTRPSVAISFILGR